MKSSAWAEVVVCPVVELQIMGVLETRMLDFKHVIVVGVNEGVIPAKGGAASFLTYDVKLNFGMNSSADNDSIFSYHFTASSTSPCTVDRTWT